MTPRIGTHPAPWRIEENEYGTEYARRFTVRDGSGVVVASFIGHQLGGGRQASVAQAREVASALASLPELLDLAETLAGCKTMPGSGWHEIASDARKVLARAGRIA